MPGADTYWAGAAQSRLMLPRCEACGRAHFYPRDRCPHCGSAELAWAEASGEGTVYSFTAVHRALDPADTDRLPFVVAIVALKEGPHMLSRIVGVAPEAVSIGDPLRFDFDPSLGTSGLPVFRQPERPATQL